MAITYDNEIAIFDNHEDVKALIERNKRTGWPDLQAYQRAFAYEFLVHFNHREAAEAAGRSASSGLKILRHPIVAAFIEQQQEQASINNFITKEYITTQLVNLIPRLAGEEEIPIVLANGEQVTGKRFHPAELRGVLQELGKTVEGFNKEKDMGGSKGGVTVNLNLADLVGQSNVIIEDGEIVDE